MIEFIRMTDDEGQEDRDYQEVSQWRDENGELLDEDGQHQAVEELKAHRERFRQNYLKDFNRIIRSKLQEGNNYETN